MYMHVVLYISVVQKELARSSVMNHQISNKSPIFPISDPQHFSDYGFDPQIDHFQVMEEARKHKRDHHSTSRTMDHHFKLQKPMPRDDSSKKIKKNKKRWWSNALHYIKSRKWTARVGRTSELGSVRRIGSISGPVYVTESRSGSSTPYRTASRPGSGPLKKGEVEIPYISLKELNMDHQQHRISTNASPIYLVT